MSYQPYPSSGKPVEPERPPAPPSIQNAVKLMYAGAAISAVSLVISAGHHRRHQGRDQEGAAEPDRHPGQPAEHVHHRAGRGVRRDRRGAVAMDGAGERPGQELGADLVHRAVRAGHPGPVRRAQSAEDGAGPDLPGADLAGRSGRGFLLWRKESPTSSGRRGSTTRPWTRASSRRRACSERRSGRLFRCPDAVRPGRRAGSRRQPRAVPAHRRAGGRDAGGGHHGRVPGPGGRRTAVAVRAGAGRGGTGPGDRAHRRAGRPARDPAGPGRGRARRDPHRRDHAVLPAGPSRRAGRALPADPRRRTGPRASTPTFFPNGPG